MNFAENVPLEPVVYGTGKMKFKEHENGEVQHVWGGFDFTINYKKPNIEQIFKLRRDEFELLEEIPGHMYVFGEDSLATEE